MGPVYTAHLLYYIFLTEKETHHLQPDQKLKINEISFYLIYNLRFLNTKNITLAFLITKKVYEFLTYFSIFGYSICFSHEELYELTS